MEKILAKNRTKLISILCFLSIIGCVYLLYEINYDNIKIRPFKTFSVQFVYYEDYTKNNNFIQINENIVKDRTNQNVVFYKIPGAGYGNRMYSMLTAFFVAVVTESALLIDWPYIENYIQTPLTNAFTKFNDSSFLDFNQKIPEICTISTNSPNTWQRNKKLDFLKG